MTDRIRIDKGTILITGFSEIKSIRIFSHTRAKDKLVFEEIININHSSKIEISMEDDLNLETGQYLIMVETKEMWLGKKFKYPVTQK